MSFTRRSLDRPHSPEGLGAPALSRALLARNTCYIPGTCDDQLREKLIGIGVPRVAGEGPITCRIPPLPSSKCRSLPSSSHGKENWNCYCEWVDKNRCVPDLIDEISDVAPWPLLSFDDRDEKNQALHLGELASESLELTSSRPLGWGRPEPTITPCNSLGVC